MRATAFALSGVRIPTIETRADSTVNATGPWDDSGYGRYEYDPVLHELLSKYSNRGALAGMGSDSESSRRVGRRWIGIREVLRRFGAVRTSLHYLSLLGKVEPPFEISSRAEIRTPHQVSFDIGTIIRAGTVLNGRSFEKPFGIQCGSDFYVKELSYIDAYGGYIKVGRGAAIAQGCTIHGNGGVEIGDYFMMGGGAMILAGNHQHRLGNGVPFIMQGSTARGVRIGRNVWLGAQSIVLDGTEIGNNVVVGAGAIVAQDIPSDSLALGSKELSIRPLQPKGANKIGPDGQTSRESIG